MDNGINRQVARKARDVALEVDERMKPEQKACKSGCDHCCYQTAWVHSWEEEEITRYVIEDVTRDKQKKIQNQLEAWHRWFDGVSRDSTRNNPLTFHEIRQLDVLAATNHIPCPYLIDSMCSIYKARPFMCRTHIVRENSEQCQTKPLRDTEVDRVQLMRTYVYGKFDPSVRPIFFRPLPYLMIKGFEVSCKSRPMFGMVIGDLSGSVSRDM